MSKKKPGGGQLPLNNPVAKHAMKFNRCEAFRDNTRYNRKLKHRRREPSVIVSLGVDDRRLGTRTPVSVRVDSGLYGTRLG